jgi:hypothetical protein
VISNLDDPNRDNGEAVLSGEIEEAAGLQRRSRLSVEAMAFLNFGEFHFHALG